MVELPFFGPEIKERHGNSMRRNAAGRKFVPMLGVKKIWPPTMGVQRNRGKVRFGMALR